MVLATTERDASGSLDPFIPSGRGVFLGVMRGNGAARRSSPSLDTRTVVYDRPLAFALRITPFSNISGGVVTDVTWNEWPNTGIEFSDAISRGSLRWGSKKIKGLLYRKIRKAMICSDRNAFSMCICSKIISLTRISLAEKT